MFLALDAGDLELAFNFYPKAKTQFACILAELEARKQGDQSCKVHIQMLMQVPWGCYESKGGGGENVAVRGTQGHFPRKLCNASF